MVRRRNNRNRRRMPRRNNKRSNLMFNSKSVNIAPTPRSTSLTVWNSYTLQRSITVANSTNANVTLGYIYDALLNRLGITGSPVLDVRILSYEAFDLAGRPIALNVYDLDSEVVSSTAVETALLRTAYDYPGRNNWARVKIMMPKAITANPTTIASSYNGVAATIQVGAPVGIANVAGTLVLLRIRLLWQANGPSSIGTSSANVFASDDIINGIPIVSREMPKLQSMNIS